MPVSDRHRLNILLFYAMVLFIGFMAFRMLEPFFMTLMWAGVLTLCALPVFTRLKKRMRPGRAAAISTIMVALLLVLPAMGLLAALVNEVSQGVRFLQDASGDGQHIQKLKEAWNWLQARVPVPPIEEVQARIAESSGHLTNMLANSARAVLQNVAMLLFHIIIALVALFFFLRDSEALADFIRDLLPFDDKRKEQLIRQTNSLVFAGTMTTLAVAAVQGVAGGIAFAVLGLNAPVLWGFVMAICALIPLAGTALIWAPAAIYLMATGSVGKGIALLVIGILIIGGVDNIMRPAMLSGKSTMNGLIAMLSIMGGLAAFGFIGIVMGPVIAAAVITLLRLAATEEA